jgi:hypothetical protein
VFTQGTCECVNNVVDITATCCSVKSSPGINVCETCSINTDTGDYYNCEVYKKRTAGLANVPQGGGIVEQPPTPKKHGGTVPPKGGGVLEQPQTGESTAKKR